MLGRYIDLGNPVSDHPLNAGLVEWWLPLPNNQGGSRLFGLRNRHHGTITDATWGTGPNGFAALKFDGTGDRVEVAHHAGLVGMAKLSVSCWVYPTSTPSADDEFVKKDSCYLLRYAASGALQGAVWTGGLNIWQSAAGVIPDNTWTWVGLRYDGAEGTTWVNGRQDGSSSFTGAVATAANALGIGASPGGGEDFPGLITDVRVQADAVDMAAIYDQSRRGYPDLLRRYPSRAYLFAPAAAAPGGNRRRRVILCGSR
jgi:hypothetical protein